MTDQLRECAFCGEFPELRNDSITIQVVCRNTECAIYGNRCDVKEWNTRASDEKVEKLVEFVKSKTELPSIGLIPEIFDERIELRKEALELLKEIGEPE